MEGKKSCVSGRSDEYPQFNYLPVEVIKPCLGTHRDERGAERGPVAGDAAGQDVDEAR